MQEILDEIRSIRSELLNLRNDVLYVQHTLNKLEKKLDKPAEPKFQDNKLENLYGPNTKIEKF
jgi:hypothetical protein